MPERYVKDIYICYFTLGCKVNQCETENIRQLLTAYGCKTAVSAEKADICVVNSCTVTGKADKKCRQLLHRIKKLSPKCGIVLTGCLPQTAKEKARELFDSGSCDVVIGNTGTRLTAEAVMRYARSGERTFDIKPHTRHEAFDDFINSEFTQKTRAYLKIQDGCDRYCSYCIIPYARGDIRSKPIDSIIHDARLLAANGHIEIVLTGINLCRYGADLDGDIRLVDAVEAVCSVDGIERVRLGSIEPELISDSDIERLAHLEKLCPHFHLSLQSGCDKTLKAMNRHYTTAQYAELVSKLRSAFPGCAITTDVMVGFAGETEEDHRQSLEFVKSMGFARVHIFPYSVRSGTAAEKMAGHIPEEIKHRRASEMDEVCRKTSHEFLSNMVGKRVKVLFEKENCTTFHNGYSENYTHIKIIRKNPQKSLRKQTFYVIINSVGTDFCLGEICD